MGKDEDVFKKNERVLCYHVDYLYPAKVIEVGVGGGKEGEV